jgi:PAS domain S-box-containing protein
MAQSLSFAQRLSRIFRPLVMIVVLFLAVFALFGLWRFVGNDPLVVSNAEVQFAMLLLAVLAGLWFAWDTGRTSARRSSLHAILSAQAKTRDAEAMLRRITDYQPKSLLIVDADGLVRFANRTAAENHLLQPQDMVGKPLVRILDSKSGQRLEERLATVHAAKAPVIMTDRSDRPMSQRVVQTYYIPLPGTADGEIGSILIAEDDITGVIVERERYEKTLRQVIDTLVAVVDRRDPYAAGHSMRVGQVARLIAREMGLDSEQTETAEIAGILMNFGKVLVPRSILTKTTPLDPDELRLVRNSILNSADILSLIQFERPIIPTLRQILERVDGSGIPEGRREENILLTARIVAVANAFVAMVSPRAHRPGLSLEDAIAALMADAGKIYDRRVVNTLMRILDMPSGKFEWLPRLATSASDPVKSDEQLPLTPGSDT